MEEKKKIRIGIGNFDVERQRNIKHMGESKRNEERNDKKYAEKYPD